LDQAAARQIVDPFSAVLTVRGSRGRGGGREEDEDGSTRRSVCRLRRRERDRERERERRDGKDSSVADGEWKRSVIHPPTPLVTMYTR